MKKIGSAQGGFTLMEMTVAMTVLGIIGVIAFNIIHNQVNSFNTVFTHTAAVSDIRKAIRLMRRDFQNLDNSNISTLEAGKLIFKNSDGKDVEYVLDGKTLIRNDKSILSNVAAAPFSYLDTEQSPTAAKDSVRFIGVKLSVLTVNTDTVSVTENIYVRN